MPGRLQRAGRRALTLSLVFAVSATATALAETQFTIHWNPANPNVWYLHNTIHKYDFIKGETPENLTSFLVCAKRIDNAGADSSIAHCGTGYGQGTFAGTVDGRPLVLHQSSYQEHLDNINRFPS